MSGGFLHQPARFGLELVKQRRRQCRREHRECGTRAAHAYARLMQKFRIALTDDVATFFVEMSLAFGEYLSRCLGHGCSGIQRRLVHLGRRRRRSAGQT